MCPTTFRDLLYCTCASLFSSSSHQIFTPAVMPDVIAMVKANICRALPPQPDDCDPDKDEPLLEEAWPHLQVRGYNVLVRASPVNRSWCCCCCCCRCCCCCCCCRCCRRRCLLQLLLLFVAVVTVLSFSKHAFNTVLYSSLARRPGDQLACPCCDSAVPLSAWLCSPSPPARAFPLWVSCLAWACQP